MYICEPGVWIISIHVIPLDPHQTSDWEALSSSHYFALLESLKSTSKGFPALLVHDSEFTLGAKGEERWIVVFIPPFMNISQASPLKELDDGEEMGNRNTPACRSKRKLSGSEGREYRRCQETDNARAGWKRAMVG